MKINLFDFKNVIITLKAFAIGLIVGVVGYFINLLAAFMLPLGLLLIMLWFIFTLFLWGYLARKWWGWN